MSSAVNAGAELLVFAAAYDRAEDLLGEAATDAVLCWGMVA